MSNNTVVAALYHFARLEDFEAMRAPLLVLMKKMDIRGTLLLAHEGINGTVSGSRESISHLIGWLKSDPRLANLVYKRKQLRSAPFLPNEGKTQKRDCHDGR
jgi:UPF0176 protein